jgi:hypothetical protein
MKLLPDSYVFIGKDNAKLGEAKLYAAEKHNDNDLAKTTASSRRPPESLAGTGYGTSSALEHGRAFAGRCPATGFF